MRIKGGNSFLTVFGKIAGREAAFTAKRLRLRPLGPNANKPKELDGGIFVVKDPIGFRTEIEQLMKESAGIVREVGKLEDGFTIRIRE